MPSEVRAMSIKRLATSHQATWERGGAQGDACFQAFRDSGVGLMTAKDIDFGICDGNGPVDQLLNTLSHKTVPAAT
eukprot:8639646-Alexandrium_andersonii.AAC.1